MTGAEVLWAHCTLLAYCPGAITLWEQAEFPLSPLLTYQLPDKHLTLYATDLTLQTGYRQL